MNDLISRQDAIRIVDSIDTWQAGWRGNAIESLKALPSAEPQHKKMTRCEDCEAFGKTQALIPQPQRTGRWVNDHCSECGQYVWYGDMRKYCPNCGARMEGE